MRTAYLDGWPIAVLAHEHGVSRSAIRTAVIDLMPEHTAAGYEEAWPQSYPSPSTAA